MYDILYRIHWYYNLATAWSRSLLKYYALTSLIHAAEIGPPPHDRIRMDGIL